MPTFIFTYILVILMNMMFCRNFYLIKKTKHNMLGVSVNCV